MSKDSPSSGLLSKVVKFVRLSGTSWSDLDAVDDMGAGQSKQALKDMIERKRHNDFVRKREFDMLRKLRTEGASAAEGYGGHPSFFHSSYSSTLEDRSGTLKKIDEIEEQMAPHLWKVRKVSAPLAPAGAAAKPSPSPRLRDRAYLPTVAYDAPTELFTASKYLEPVDADQKPDKPSATPGWKTLDQSDIEVFEGSRFYSPHVQELALDPEIEEAAIRFAFGETQSAEQGLLEVLNRKGKTGTSDEWMALLDVYRATGQQAPFEQQAQAFAVQFSRPAPAWSSMPDEVAACVLRAPGQASAPTTTWTAPSDLDAGGVRDLNEILRAAQLPWVLDWSGLRAVQPDAVDGLSGLVAGWANADVELVFKASVHLLEVLVAGSAAAQSADGRGCWSLRLALLRAMHKADDFAATALDFSVACDQPAPVWVPPLCRFSDLPEAGAVSAAALVFENHGRCELLGEISGDPQPHLDRLERAMEAGAPCEVLCRHLIRVDFSAAGGILNWVSTHGALGREIRFVDVHRLIAAFFHVIGITEHAKVVTRND